MLNSDLTLALYQFNVNRINFTSLNDLCDKIYTGCIILEIVSGQQTHFVIVDAIFP